MTGSFTRQYKIFLLTLGISDPNFSVKSLKMAIFSPEHYTADGIIFRLGLSTRLPIIRP